MEQTFTENPESFMAKEFVLHTNQSVFVTGRAGTGKTTFLRNVRETSRKKMAVAAPTGIAAINAGGVTLHSLFQLPFGTYIPDSMPPQYGATYYTKHTLIQNLRMGEDKQRLLRELELLVIDEVSMLRCDLLDAIDAILRHVRGNRDEAFGGLQVLFIGDPMQLPPVINQQEWQVLSAYYDTPFFFSSQVFREMDVLYIEFKSIYRQKEERFIQLLEKVRNGNMNDEDIDLLNSRYEGNVERQEGVITLTSHNNKAELINRQALEELSGSMRSYDGKLGGEFSEKNLPADKELSLKRGAQVMFVKNDSYAEKRYYNGKMGRIMSLSDDEVVVECTEDGRIITVERETWETVRYVYSAENDRVEEESTGSYTQFPLKLAWAITIHKSQGLTFDSVVIDAANAFAAGQVYVALSRCRSLKGIALTSPIRAEVIQSDERLKGLSDREKDYEELQELLKEAKITYGRRQLARAFRFERELDVLRDFEVYTLSKKFEEKEMVLSALFRYHEHTKKLADTGRKFVQELEQIFSQDADNLGRLEERVGKAIAYFHSQLHDAVAAPLTALHVELKPKKGVKQFVSRLAGVEEWMWNKLGDIQHLEYAGVYLDDYKAGLKQRTVTHSGPITKVKAQKGDSDKESLKFFQDGKSIPEIAELRNMAVSTVEAHLCNFIKTGDVTLEKLLPMEKIDDISMVIKSKPAAGLKAFKDELGEGYSYGEIKFVVTHLESLKS